MTYETETPDYEFQSAKWVNDDGTEAVIIERAAGPQKGGYNTVVTNPESGDEVPTTVLAENVSESAADKAARDYLTDT